MLFTSDTAKKEFIKITQKQFKEKYQMVQPIGKGAYGQVHLAKSKHNNMVAIKKFKYQAVQYFYVIIREISNLKRMDHPNVLKLYDCYIVNDNLYYMVTQYCSEGCLTDYLPKVNTEREKIVICQQIAQGLAHAHQLGIVHRDLKPQNIFVGNRNIVKIGDFGCSTRIQNNQVLTSRVGSPAYMDDRVDKYQSYDNTADIYSLGMVYIWIFKGQGIYDQCQTITDLKRIKSQIYRDYDSNIELYIEGLPVPIKQIVKNCLNLQYGIRYSAQKIASIIGQKLSQEKSGTKTMISTQDEFDQSLESQINTFACSLIAMNKDFQFRYRCQKTRQELFNLLIKNKANLQAISNIQTLKYVQPDTKAQFTFIVFLFYKYWLQQIMFIINGEQSQLGIKYKQIDSKAIEDEVYKKAENHIKSQTEKIESVMIGCARRIQGTLHLMDKQKYLPENFKEFINAVSQREDINFGKATYRGLLENINKFIQMRIKKEYQYNRGGDVHDEKLGIVARICDSFL